MGAAGWGGSALGGLLKLGCEEQEGGGGSRDRQRRCSEAGEELDLVQDPMLGLYLSVKMRVTSYRLPSGDTIENKSSIGFYIP